MVRSSWFAVSGRGEAVAPIEIRTLSRPATASPLLCTMDKAEAICYDSVAMEQTQPRPPLRHYASAALVTAAITGGMLFVEPPLELANIALFYLLGVFVVATSAGLGPGILASLLSFLAFNFFFVPPLYTFHVQDSQNVFRLVTFLIVAVIASSLAARARTEAGAARRRAAETAALYDLSQTISAQLDLD